MIYSLLFLIFLFLNVQYSLGQKFEIETIVENRAKEKRMNIVFLADGYQACEQNKFIADARAVSDYIFNIEPLKMYKQFFNIYAVKVPSKESGATEDQNNPVKNYFGSSFGYGEIDRFLWPTKEEKVMRVLAHNFPNYDQAILLANTDKYGGGGGWIATVSAHPESGAILIHELGHSFAGLSDEYWAGHDFARENVNMTQKVEPNHLVHGWKEWHGSEQVDIISYQEDARWHYPHLHCKMRALENEFCPVCRQAIIESIQQNLSPIETFGVQTVVTEDAQNTLQFTGSYINPEPYSLSGEWQINEKHVTEKSPHLNIVPADLQDNINHVFLTVEDTNRYVRENKAWGHELFHTVSWKIQKGLHEIIASEAISSSIAFFPDLIAGTVSLTVSGELQKKIRLEVFTNDEKPHRIYSIPTEQEVEIPINKPIAENYCLRFYQGDHLLAERWLHEKQEKGQ